MSGNEEMESGENSGDLNHRVKSTRAKRAIKKRKFTRKYGLFKEKSLSEENSKLTRELYDEVIEAYSALEEWNERYMLLISEDDEEELAAADAYILEVEHLNLEVKEIFKKLENHKKDEALGEGKVKVKALQPPDFNGDIRRWRMFYTDWHRLMIKVYGRDPYALRSCLSGEALEVVKGVEHSFDEMIERLENKYADHRKLVDVVINDLKTIKPLEAGDSKGFAAMVDKVERCWLDLKRTELEQEMNTTATVSYIEKILPDIQKRAWIIQSEEHRNSPNLFLILKEFLLKERRVLDHMNAEICSSKPGRRSSSMHQEAQLTA